MFLKMRPPHLPLNLHQNSPELPHTEVICKRAEAAKQFLEEGGQSTLHCPSTKEFEPSHHEAPKHHIKQGLVKSNKNKKKLLKIKLKMMMRRLS